MYLAVWSRPTYERRKTPFVVHQSSFHWHTKLEDQPTRSLAWDQTEHFERVIDWTNLIRWPKAPKLIAVVGCAMDLG